MKGHLRVTERALWTAAWIDTHSAELKDDQGLFETVGWTLSPFNPRGQKYWTEVGSDPDVRGRSLRALAPAGRLRRSQQASPLMRSAVTTLHAFEDNVEDAAEASRRGGCVRFPALDAAEIRRARLHPR